MLEIAKNVFLVKSKIIGMKVVGKDGKFWVVFNCGKVGTEEQSSFSSPFESEEQAKAFLNACAAAL